MKTEILVYIESLISKYINEEDNLSLAEKVHLRCCMSELLNILFDNSNGIKIGLDLYNELSRLDTDCYFIKVDNFIERLHNVR